LSQLFRVGLSTARAIVQDTCFVIARVLADTYLKTPRSENEWLAIANDFAVQWQFPHCIGAIDGKHIRVIAPRNSGSYFYNYKDFFSIVLLAIVSADYQIIYLDLGSEGKASDGGIWQRCSFYEHLNDANNPLNIPRMKRYKNVPVPIPFYLVGDDAFGLASNLMKPYKGYGLTKKQRIFNYRLSHCQRTVENVFGIISSRFKIFRRPIELNPTGAQNITFACCVLHNYLVDNSQKQYISNDSVDVEMPNGQVVPAEWRQEINLPTLAKNT
jgi:hypothetical protein